jgi:hypothetical protein
VIVFGCDAAWGGLGYCLASARGPYTVGHVKLGGRAWRWDALDKELVRFDKLLEPFVRDEELVVAVEQPPSVFSGRGNQSTTSYGLGTMCGALLLWAARQRRPGWRYPWAVPVSDWRGWWNIRGKGTEAKKAAALWTVKRHGWGGFIEPWTGDAQADVAEALLLAVGAAMRPELAPKGPRR